MNDNTNTRVKIGEVRLSYCHLFTPEAISDGGDKKYSVALLIPKSNTALVAAINDAVKAAFMSGVASKFGGKQPAPGTWKNPLRDGDAERPDDETYAGCYFINATSKTKPGIVKIVKMNGEKKLVEVTDLVKDCGFGVFADAASKKGWSVRGINAKGQGGMGRKQIDKIVEMARGNGAKGLPYIQIKEDGSVKCSFAKFVSEEEIQALVSRMGGEAGDLLFFAADKNGIVWNVLGALRLKLGEDLGLIDHNQFNFLWVVDFPLLEWSEEENRFVAMHHPFTMPVEEDWERIDSDPGSVRAKAYDIVLNGVELGGGSVRIHQSDIQEKMFEVIGLSKEEANEKFGFLLTAFKYGVPPHAGLAYGVDRFVMLLTGADSIREVIAFPKNKDAADLMSGAPDVVDPVQLTDLHIAVEKEAE